ncbi:thiolase family protein [Nocardioides sp. L-11A]|uniref:thiolase family protein n=1 Tax=Nocardioides sp. L-11A TaxID=3043848 RepID=UPI00249BDE3C|nr:thiolase family protein [Nocardioides sp. L-11A]
MGNDVAIVGIGMTRFGRQPGVTGRQMAVAAVREACADAGVSWSDMQFAFGGTYSCGDADTLISLLGLTGAPFINVYNGCGTGGSSLISAANAIKSGERELGLVLGFDKHPPGAFNESPENVGLGAWYGETGFMVTTQFFATKIQRYLHEWGIAPSALSLVAEKAYRNGALSEKAWRQQPVPAEVIGESTMVNDPLTKLMFCSPGEGAVALVVASPEKARSLTSSPVYLSSAELRSRRFGSFEVYSPWLSPTRVDSVTTDASRAAFEAAGVAPADVRVAQIQDTESGAEIMHMAETGLCEHGEQEKLLVDGETEIGGRIPVNTDGGVLANGEPIGASGLRQVHEIVLQLRGQAGARQVPGDPSVGFTQVYGAPGISACTVLTR